MSFLSGTRHASSAPRALRAPTPSRRTGTAALCGVLTLVSSLGLLAGGARAERDYRAEDLATRLDPKVEALLERFEEAQATTRTMTARFRQVREDDLFAEAKVISGAYWFTHPSNFRWEYQDEDAGQIVMLATKDLIQRWIPDWKVVEQTDISKKSRRVFQYFGIGSDVDNLRKRFDITVNESDTSHAGADKLELRGRWRRVKKRLEVLEMWIDRESSLPVAVRVVLPDGGSTSWEFSDLVINPEVPERVYHPPFPPGTTIRDQERRLSTTDEILQDILDGDDEEPPLAGSASGRR